MHLLVLIFMIMNKKWLQNALRKSHLVLFKSVPIFHFNSVSNRFTLLPQKIIIVILFYSSFNHNDNWNGYYYHHQHQHTTRILIYIQQIVIAQVKDPLRKPIVLVVVMIIITNISNGSQRGQSTLTWSYITHRCVDFELY